MPPQKMNYQEIADDIAARIRSGEYPPDSEIPSYNRIAELYGVGRSTAQAAVRLLRDRGLVVGVRGRGVYVAEPNG